MEEKSETMKRPLIRPVKCQNCSPCQVETKCPKCAVIREEPMDKPWVDFYKCGGCMQCKAWCAHDAIEEMTQPCDGKGRMGW